MKEDGQILQLSSLRLGTCQDNISLPWTPKFVLNPTFSNVQYMILCSMR